MGVNSVYKIIFMIKVTEADKFELGTISIFTGLSFITFIPVFLRYFLIYIEPNFFKIIGGFFIFASAFFYYFSPGYYKKQLFVLGLNLTVFSFLQLFFSTGMQDFRVLNVIAPVLGIFLMIVSIYLEKYKKQ
jgi:hypothetical protein